MKIECEHCDGKGWTWDKGCDTSEECSWCKGTGEIETTESGRETGDG